VLLCVVVCWFSRKKFLCEERGDQNNNNRQFFVFLFCLEKNLFDFTPHKKLSHHQKKKKMADTSMDYSEYSENENSPMPVAKVRESIRIER